MLLYIKNIDIEGPETLGKFFEERGFISQTIDLQSGDPLPENVDNFEAVVVFGGPMNVYEEDKFPFLKAETEFIKEALKHNIPILGLCLGSQLLAKASGAKVTKSPQQELGFFDVELTEEGKVDPLFEGFEDKVEVYQWHGDMFEIPENGHLLASGDACPHQAFRVGENAYGLQFHIEITDKSIAEWSDKYFDAKDEKQMAHKLKMLDDYVTKKESFNNTAGILYCNFLKIIERQNEDNVKNRVSPN